MFGREVITEVDGGQIIAHFISAVPSLRGVAVAELANLIRSPTLDGIIIKDGAGIIFHSTNRLGGMPTTEIDKLQVSTHLIWIVTTIIGCADA